MLRLAIGRPSCVRRISGSLPRLPTRITLFTLPAIAALHASQNTGRTGPASRSRLAAPVRRPIRSTARLSLRSPSGCPGYPHIAPPASLFQFCSSALELHPSLAPTIGRLLHSKGSFKEIINLFSTHFVGECCIWETAFPD